jgi:hypothetical protein
MDNKKNKGKDIDPIFGEGKIDQKRKVQCVLGLYFDYCWHNLSAVFLLWEKCCSYLVAEVKNQCLPTREKKTGSYQESRESRSLPKGGQT